MNPESLDTRQSLTLAALDLLAERGLDAVSMRTINQAAGTRNASAVHYYFGNRDGMLKAIIEFISTELDGWRQDALAELENRDDAPTNQEVLWAAFRPYAKLYSERDHGPNAIRFLARMQHERPATGDYTPKREGPDGGLNIHDRLVRLLRKANADWDAALAQSRYFLFWTLMVQGFAIKQNIPDAGSEDAAENVRVATLQFFDFLLGGVQAPRSERSSRH
ncbi:MAG: TetR/AcrR family transcriptional regulator [Pseudomonadaceae bacterium]|nr:TetR/AcrR family transcriptional regulator [Pseudomonadaceae bacterium]